MILFLLLSVALADCTKEIKVLAYRQKAVPSLFNFAQKKYIQGEQMITIKCELYKTIKVGDVLQEEEIKIGMEDFLTGTPAEIQHYKVLEK